MRQNMRRSKRKLDSKAELLEVKTQRVEKSLVSENPPDIDLCQNVNCTDDQNQNVHDDHKLMVTEHVNIFNL